MQTKRDRHRQTKTAIQTHTEIETDAIQRVVFMGGREATVSL